MMSDAFDEIWPNRDRLARIIYEVQLGQLSGSLASRMRAYQTKCIRDATHNLSHLAVASFFSSEKLFTSYVEWLKVLFEGLRRKRNGDYAKPQHNSLGQHFELTLSVLEEELSDKALESINPFLARAINQTNNPVRMPPSEMPSNPYYRDVASEYLSSLLNLEKGRAKDLIYDLHDNLDVLTIYDKILGPVLREVGRLWHIGELDVADEHFITEFTKTFILELSLLEKNFTNKNQNKRAFMMAVGLEHHNVGLQMVKHMFDVGGWDTFMIGGNLPASYIVPKLKHVKPKAIAISTTIPTNLVETASLVRSIKKAKCNGTIVVGGYPYTLDTSLWRTIGADYYSPDAHQTLAYLNTA